VALKKNRVKRILKEGGVCFGTMLRILKVPHAVSLFSASGWDYLIMDMEHNDCDLESLSALSLVAKYEETTFLVRVPDKHYFQMAQVLDLGLEGLILPRVDTPDQVNHILQSTRYFPLGSRGASISNVATLFRSYPALDYLKWANQETMIVIQIESQEAVENVDQLLSIEGIDAVMIGPFDLSQSMGIPGQLKDPRMEEAFQKVIDGCNRHGVAPGVHLTNFDDVEKWLSRGMRFITFQYDISMLVEASREKIGRLREMVPGQA